MEHVFEKCRKTALCLALAVIVVFAGIALASRDVRAAELISGTGWSLSDDLTLTIGGGVDFDEVKDLRNRYSVKKLVVESNLSGIKPHAFESFEALETVTLNSEVKTIGEGAFQYCRNLNSINLTNVELIDHHAFEGCPKLSSVSFGDRIKIGIHAFFGCTSLSSVDFGGLTEIGAHAFEATALKNVDLSNIDTVGECAFRNCKALESVVLGNDKLAVPFGCFEGCTKLSSIDLSNIETINSRAFYGCTSLGSVTLTRVRVIDSDAFTGCTGLKSLDLPVANYIGKNAFDGCIGLTTVNFGSSSVSVSKEAFRNCSKLSTINTEKISSINDGVFTNCSSLQSVVLGSGVTAIGEKAFYQCSALTTINLSNIKTIKVQAFSDCALLDNVDLRNCFEMQKYAFNGCTALTSVDLSGGYMYFEGVFQGCTGLTSVTLGDQLTNIPDYAFDGCTNLSTVNFDSVYVIGKYAFRNTKLTSLDLRYVSVISDGAFSGCQVTDLTLGYRYGIYTHSGNPDTDSFVFDNITSFYFYGPQRIYDQRNLGADFPNATITIGGAYDVIFDYGNGESCTVIEEGETVDNPGDLSRDYFIFTGWYSDKECTLAYDFSLPVTKDIRIYAGWISDLTDSFFKGYTLSLGGNIGINYYTIIPEGADPENDYIKFTVGDEPGETKVYLKDASTVSYKGTEYSVFKFEVPAKMMTNVIIATLYMNGRNTASKWSSIRQYADYILANQDLYSKELPLVRAMLNYGAYAQIYFNYRTDELANKNLYNGDYSLDNADFTRPYDSSFTNLPDGLSFSSVSLALESDTYLNLYFADNTNKKLTFKLVIGNKETVLTPASSNGNIKIVLKGIPAHRLNEDYKIKITVEGDSTEYYLTYSPIMYAYNIISRAQDEIRTPELKDLMKALYLYNQAAKAYK